MKFNINYYVRVKLTETGIEILRKDHDAIMEMIPEEKRYPFKLELTPDGWYRTQAWCLMETFGPHIHIGGGYPFETEIDIEC